MSSTTPTVAMSNSNADFVELPVNCSRIGTAFT